MDQAPLCEFGLVVVRVCLPVRAKLSKGRFAQRPVRRKKPRVFASRPRRFPVARAPQKSQKTLSFCTSTTPIPAEGRAGKKNHGFLHLDHADPRRGSRERCRNRKKQWVFAPRPRRSSQRVDFRVASSALPRRPKKRFLLLASQLHLAPCTCNLRLTPCACNSCT